MRTVVAATDRGIEFHQLPDVGEENPRDMLSTFSGSVHRCDVIGSDIVYAYTSDGISSFTLSAGSDGIVRISALTETDYAGCDVYDWDKLDVGSGFDFIATADGLCAGHYEFKPAVSVPDISSGYSFAEHTYAILTPTGMDFYSKSDKIVEYGKAVTAVS